MKNPIGYLRQYKGDSKEQTYLHIRNSEKKNNLQMDLKVELPLYQRFICVSKDKTSLCYYQSSTIDSCKIAQIRSFHSFVSLLGSYF
jgi:hypothetical protein